MVLYKLGQYRGAERGGRLLGVVWIVAEATNNGWYEPILGAETSDLTFEAPLLTVLLPSVGLIVGYWSGIACGPYSGRDGG